MYSDGLANATVGLVTLAAVMLCVVVHYEGLTMATRRVAREGGSRRAKVLHGILTVLALHVIEIWIFGMAIWLLLLWPDCGSVAGAEHFLDLIYLSAMSFTTVGFGDVAPLGPLRLLAATEALTGFVLIAWSASFTFLEMERFWRGRVDS
jgi:hypothetical protein